jgi:dihydropteroate synthase
LSLNTFFIAVMTINCNQTILDLSKPAVMGILNITPDSFFDGNRWNDEISILNQSRKMLDEGAAIIDVGGMSSRPGAQVISVEEEMQRVLPVVALLVNNFRDVVISIDTMRAEVAKAAIESGAAIVNDISAGTFDDKMIETVAALQVPYILMHKQGMPIDMQHNPVYKNVVIEVFDFLQKQVRKCKAAGIKDVIVDVGFGFGKTVEHNFLLLKNLSVFKQLNCPILIGVSRKSMITKTLSTNAESALNGTTAANTIGLMNGANILRVHDVKEAVEAVKIYCSATA